MGPGCHGSLIASESRRRFSVPASRSSRPGAAQSTPAGRAGAAGPAAAGGAGSGAGGGGAGAALQGMCPSWRSCRRSAAACGAVGRPERAASSYVAVTLPAATLRSRNRSW